MPGNIPVAAEGFDALLTLGSPWVLRSDLQALVIVTHHPTDPCIVWPSKKLQSYVAVWDQAAAAGFVEPASAWGAKVDIDHVFPRSWANLPTSKLEYVRLFPVWAEVNRSAGAGREKHGLRALMTPLRKQGIVYAQELQVLKMLGHPVGTASRPEEIWGARRGP